MVAVEWGLPPIRIRARDAVLVASANRRRADFRCGRRGHHPDPERGAIDRRGDWRDPLWAGSRDHHRRWRQQRRDASGGSGRRRPSCRRQNRRLWPRLHGGACRRRGEYDLVLASRARGVREPGAMSWHQLLAGRLAGLGTKALYGVRYTDMCAYRAIRRDCLERLDMRELTYGWNLEMQMRAARAGLRILELALPYRRRRGGKSKVAGTLSGSLRAALRIVVTFVRVAAASGRGDH